MIDRLRELAVKKMNINKDNELYKKYLLINKILADDKCFFKMDITYAYAILRDLGIEEYKLKDIYMELIDIKNS